MSFYKLFISLQKNFKDHRHEYIREYPNWRIGKSDFENDLHRHIHLENNILFPKAIELEKQISI